MMERQGSGGGTSFIICGAREGSARRGGVGCRLRPRSMKPCRPAAAGGRDVQPLPLSVCRLTPPPPPNPPQPLHTHTPPKPPTTTASHTDPPTHPPTCTVLSMCSRSWCVTPSRLRSSPLAKQKPRRCQVALVRASSGSRRRQGRRGGGRQAASAGASQGKCCREADRGGRRRPGERGCRCGAWPRRGCAPVLHSKMRGMPRERHISSIASSSARPWPVEGEGNRHGGGGRGG
jgi:hypothetical protein